MAAPKLRVLEENWKRALADYHNLVKRVEADRKQLVKFANSNLIAKLLPALDSLELAAAHSADPGIGMAVKQFRQALFQEGLEEVAPQPGEKFDPVLHECIETVEGEAADTIAQLTQKGYKIEDDVLRPARVKVVKQQL